MRVTYLGITTLLFDDGTDQVLFDCCMSRPGIAKLLFSSIKTDKNCIDRLFANFQINRLKAVFISHTHYDHVLDLAYIANKTKCDTYGTSSAVNVAKGGCVSDKQVHEYDYEKTYEIGDFKIKVLKSIHSKPMWFNNDIGDKILKPLKQPCSMRHYKEGGSVDFYIEHSGKSYLIRPSFNYLQGELDSIKADVMFQSFTNLSKCKKKEVSAFFDNTLAKVKPSVVIPVHWDNLFKSFYNGVRSLHLPFENTDKSFFMTGVYCTAHGASFVIVPPLSFIDI